MNAGETNQRFRDVVLPHLGEALALARWLTGSPHDAEDVVQEACLKALAGIAGYNGGSAKSWVLAIVRNSCFTWLGKHRSKRILLTGDMAAFTEALPGTAAEVLSEPGPEAALIGNADIAQIEQAIAALPEQAREVVVLRDVNGLSYREIASLLGLPIGTVMSRLARARAMLIAEIGRTA